jgi:hypothetical protein
MYLYSNLFLIIIFEFHSRNTRNVLEGCTFRNIYRTEDNGSIFYLGDNYDITMIDCSLNNCRTDYGEYGHGAGIYSEGFLFLFLFFLFYLGGTITSVLKLIRCVVLECCPSNDERDAGFDVL